ncbi:N-acetylmuramoyl-L-alanine amidase [Litoribacter ruber]|uniref:N-acetylmuramoyl-L-alanine amidase n=1 Tax=Litoribacter ruber TaxID=702568 RepID=A0AAP2G5D2_9BACT|nr:MULTISPECIES: peptidoglycan recognition family protein [Litoribacter]MBS9525410.1 N-acetylmuramoyl-L-alanine amidase [Litoribacter alkaliphilus]MBT0810497.1 N-acetylmuramoyl-L-alanine amidase [Litoribacter ruber]
MSKLVHLILLSLISLPAFAQNKGDFQSSIIKREDWNAKPPQFEIPAHTPQFITLHHTAVKQNAGISIEQKLQNLQAFSISSDPLADGTPRKGWSDVPYHFYIDMDGNIAEGRKIELQGDSNTNYDLSGHVSIVLEGNFEVEEVSPSQLASLQNLIAFLNDNYGLPLNSISGHLDQAMTSCPGKNLYSLIPQLQSTP